VRPLAVPAAAEELHQRLLVADLHADPLLWRRDLTKRSTSCPPASTGPRCRAR
jgi:hypothetical protein